MAAIQIRDLAASHGCPPGCRACAAAAAAGGFDPLDRWAGFFAGESAARVARYAAAHGYPALSEDHVTQFLLEEALGAMFEAQRAAAIDAETKADVKETKLQQRRQNWERLAQVRAAHGV